MLHNLLRGGTRSGPGLVALSFCALLVLLAASPGYGGNVSTDVCAGCHDDVASSFGNTPHGIYFSERPALAEFSCEQCHGSGTTHIEEGTASSIINPARHDQFGGKELCLTCHSGPTFDDWSFSHHETAGLNCSDCHTVHAKYEHSLKKPAPELCYDCHSDVRASFYMPSHHPVREGDMGCLDCHNAHGGDVKLAQNGTPRELCFSCHADKEGPFVFEHAPVNEDCMLCHTPHGAVANNLLKENEPALCLNCHPMHFHATIEGVDGAFTVPLASDRNGISTSDGFKRGFLTKCTQCHSEIHGTDMMSQSISGGGGNLTR